MSIKQKVSKKETEKVVSSIHIEENEHDGQKDSHDFFKLKIDNFFTEEDVFEIELPKILLKNSMKNLQSIQEKTSINIYFIADESNPDIGIRVLKAMKYGIKEFKINFDSNLQENVWKFTKPYIKAVDFGNLQKIREESPRIIQCELEFDSLTIDDEELC